MTWNGQFIETGTLTYSVNGVMVTKNVVRQTLVLDNYNGTYLGALYATVTGCSNPANNGTAGGSATTTVVQSGQAVSITIVGPTNSITLSGFLTQYGQFGSIQGMYNVSSGEAGNFSMYEINGQQSHWTARYALTSANTGCQSNGYVGGMRQR